MDEKEMVKIGVDGLLKPFSSLIERLFGGYVDQKGGEWEDAAKVRRLRRQLRLYAKVQEMLDDSGVEAKQVSDKLGFSLIAAASVEDDPDIQDRWAAMLANSADPREENKVDVLFVNIMREMTPEAVRFLDALLPASPERYSEVSANVDPTFPGQIRQKILAPPSFDKDGKMLPPVPRQITEFRKSGLLDAYVRAGMARCPQLAMPSYADWKDHGDDLRADNEGCQYIIDLLTRNKIMSESIANAPFDGTKLVADVITRSSQRNEVKVQAVALYSLTQLGQTFIRACRPPRPSPEP